LRWAAQHADRQLERRRKDQARRGGSHAAHGVDKQRVVGQPLISRAERDDDEEGAEQQPGQRRKAARCAGIALADHDGQVADRRPGQQLRDAEELAEFSGGQPLRAFDQVAVGKGQHATEALHRHV